MGLRKQLVLPARSASRSSGFRSSSEWPASGGSLASYRALFGREPRIRTSALVAFDVSGGLYGIDPRLHAAHELQGGSARPYIRVADLDSAFARAGRVAPGRIEAGQIIRKGRFRFFRVTDPEGTVIELYSVEEY